MKPHIYRTVIDLGQWCVHCWVCETLAHWGWGFTARGAFKDWSASRWIPIPSNPPKTPRHPTKLDPEAP